MADASASVDRGDTLIAERIDRAQRVIRRTDIALTLVMWIACLMAVLLVWVLIDHWIIEAGPVLRVGTFAALLLGSGWFLWHRLRHIVRGQLNPLYAAYLLERELPELDHGLASYVALRDDRLSEGLRGVVIRSVGARAAGRLAHRPEIDPTSGGRSGKLVAISVGLFTALVAYTVLSPKSTFSSMRRLLMPLANVAPPTRVKIDSVLPGDTEIVQGETLTVESKIRGLLASESPRVEYSSRSTTTTTALEPSDGSDVYTGSIGGEDGVRNPLQYVIRAGDAQAGPFRVRVRSVPAVEISKVEYQPPDYTGLPTRSSPRGAIEGVEGTRVIVTARVNRPAEKARIEFNPKEIRGAMRPTGGVLPLKIREEGREVEGFWYLLTDRSEVGVIPQTSYRFRVWDEHGTPNPDPVVYPIRVQPDLAPEVEIVTPRNWPKDVQQSAQQIVEVRALDPDFGLTALEVEVRQGNRVLKTLELMSSPQGRRGQQVGLYRFRPKELRLSHGDEVTLVARATDNRHRPGSDEMQPNVAETNPVTLRVVADKHADPQQIAPDSDGAGPPDESPTTQDVTGGEREPKEDAPGEGTEDSQQAESDGQGQGESGDGAQETAGDQQSPEGGSQQGAGAAQNDTGAGAGSQGDEQLQRGADAGADSTSEATGQQPDGQRTDGQQPSGQSPGGEQPTGGDDASPADATDGQQPGAGTGDAGQRDGSQRADAAQEASQRQDAQNGSAGGEGGQEGAAQQDASGGNQPAGADSGALERNGAGSGSQSSGGDEGPLHDGEVFERALEYIRQQQQQQGGNASGETDGAQNQRPPNGGQSDGGQERGQKRAPDPDAQQQNGSESRPGSEDRQDGAGAQSGDSRSQSQQSQGTQDGAQAGRGSEGDGAQGADRQGQEASPDDGGANAGADSGAGEPQGGGADGSPASPGDGQAPGQPPGDAPPGGQGSSATQPSDAASQQGGAPAEGASQGSEPGAQGSQSPAAAGEGSSPDGSGRAQQQQPPGSNSPGEPPSGAGTPAGSQQPSQQQPAGGSDESAGGGGKPADGGSSGDGPAQGTPSGGTPSGRPATGQTPPGGQASPGAQQPGGAPSDQGGSPAEGGQAGSDAQTTPGGGQSSAGGDAGQGGRAAGEPGGGGEGAASGGGQRSTEPPTAGGQGAPGAGGQVGQGAGDASQTPGASPGNASGSRPGQPGSPQPLERSADGQGLVPDRATTEPGSRQGTGAGGQPSEEGGGAAIGGTGPQRDEINMEYSEEATDMVLDYLRRQREQPDEELLDRLNFSADDLQDFVDRWEATRRLGDTEGQEAYREQLKSLGLRPPGAAAGDGVGTDDAQRGLRDAGNRNRVPARFQEAFDAFRRSLSRQR